MSPFMGLPPTLLKLVLPHRYVFFVVAHRVHPSIPASRGKVFVLLRHSQHYKWHRDGTRFLLETIVAIGAVATETKHQNGI
jgi:hypothetical protein